MTYPRAIAMMSKAYTAPPPPPPPPPPALAVSTSSLGTTYVPNGGPGGAAATSSTVVCSVTNNDGVPVTNPSYHWTAYYFIDSDVYFCSISGQGTPSATITTPPIPDNTVVSVLYSCNLDDLDRPGRSATSGQKTWIVRTEYIP